MLKIKALLPAIRNITNTDDLKVRRDILYVK